MPKSRTKSTGPNIDEITALVGRKFRSFGGGQTSDFNPLTAMLRDKPFQFAAGVDVREVVKFILTQAKR